MLFIYMLYLVLSKMCTLMCAEFFLYHERLHIITMFKYVQQGLFLKQKVGYTIRYSRSSASYRVKLDIGRGSLRIKKH